MNRSFVITRICLNVAIGLMIIICVIMPGCSAPSIYRETLTQISTMGAILNGAYDGVMDFETLKTYGDFGIGTFDSLDGEMVELDGSFYQVRADGVAYPVTGEMKTPFASVTFFDVDRKETLPEGISFNQLPDYMNGLLPTKNIFYAIKIKGTFTYVKTRSVPSQEKPYPPLVEVTANQPTFEFTDVKGVVVGFLCPDYVSGVNVPGYHLHFLTDSKDAGGHLLDFTVKQATISFDATSDFLMLLPGEASGFYELDLSQDQQGELEEAEK